MNQLKTETNGQTEYKGEMNSQPKLRGSAPSTDSRSSAVANVDVTFFPLPASRRPPSLSSRSKTARVAPPHPVNICGPVPGATVSDIFQRLSTRFTGRLKRLPDGEASIRSTSELWQRQMIDQAGVSHVLKTESDESQAEPDENEMGTTMEQLASLQTGYDRAASASYSRFQIARREGIIPDSVKFQVEVMSPCTFIASWIRCTYRYPVAAAYQNALLRSISNIQCGIPHGELAIQIDIGAEFAILQNDRSNHEAAIADDERLLQLVSKIIVITDAIAADVDVGFHLGNPDLRRIIRMQEGDLNEMVGFIGAVIQNVHRHIAWLSIPILGSREDVAFFAPLKWLVPILKARNTELFLNLVPLGDIASTRRRLRAASTALEGLQFGITLEGSEESSGDFSHAMDVVAGVQ